MKKKILCLQFKNSEQKFLFEDKVFIIEDKKLINELEKPAYKNTESELFIKSSNDLHISDVLQVKINLSETGYFLVSFVKDSLNEDRRKDLIEEISSLKSKAVQTNSTQLNKTKRIVEILNKYHPLYATFFNNGIYKVNITKVSQEELKFPILVLEKKEKRAAFHFGFKKNQSSLDTYSSFPLFDSEYLFILLFALLGSFGICTATFQIMNKQAIAIFLSIIGLTFNVILVVAMTSAIYKKGQQKNPFLRYYLCLFILLGIAIGIVGGYFISKFMFKTEIEDFNYSRFLLISIIVSVVALLSSASTSRLVNLIKRKTKKNEVK